MSMTVAVWKSRESYLFVFIYFVYLGAHTHPLFPNAVRIEYFPLMATYVCFDALQTLRFLACK